MVSQAGHGVQDCGEGEKGSLLGHVNRPDACSTAHVEDAGCGIEGDGCLVQLVSPCYREELVVDVHAVFFWLVAWEHVDASAVAMIPATVFQIIGVVSRYWQPVVDRVSESVE